MKKKIRVLVVDDSAVVRQAMAEILKSDDEIEVVATASDPFIAADKIRHEIPDVITLDIEMPRMDGITFLHKIMSQHPIPVVICSSLALKGCETTLKALEYGAVDIIEKPRIDTLQFLRESSIRICDTVKAASHAHLQHIPAITLKVTPKLTADAVIAKPISKAMIQTTEKVVVVGASTGGTEALRVFLQTLPHDAPGMLSFNTCPRSSLRRLHAV